MARQRDYREEYRRRIQRGLAGGLSRSQARGHAQPGERPAKSNQASADRKVEIAIRRMNRGESMTASAKAAHVSAERLRRVLAQGEIAQRKGRRWITSDTRPRRVPVITDGRVRVVIADGFEPAQLAGAHHHAAGEFVRTNDAGLLKPFEGKSVRVVSGRKYVLETDPNALHRIAAMETPPFHEIYEIISTT